jgi:hypothetical protein
MSQIDDYLEFTQLLPRDYIKILKLIREIDEKCLSIHKIIKFII